MNVPTGQCCPPSIGMVAAFKLESLAGIVGIRNALPDLPTVSEFVPGYEVSSWFGIGLPRNTELVSEICTGR